MQRLWYYSVARVCVGSTPCISIPASDITSMSGVAWKWMSPCTSEPLHNRRQCPLHTQSGVVPTKIIARERKPHPHPKNWQNKAPLPEHVHTPHLSIGEKTTVNACRGKLKFAVLFLVAMKYNMNGIGNKA
eukprot:31333-Amphidinium_carterae.1